MYLAVAGPDHRLTITRLETTENKKRNETAVKPLDTRMDSVPCVRDSIGICQRALRLQNQFIAGLSLVESVLRK
jgi:hypothetical protein